MYTIRLTTKDVFVLALKTQEDERSQVKNIVQKHDIIVDKLELPASSTTFQPDVKARNMYATCMNTDDYEDTGLSEGLYKFLDLCSSESTMTLLTEQFPTVQMLTNITLAVQFVNECTLEW